MIKYSEVVKTVDLEPISVSDDPHENYNFRVEILRRRGSSGYFHVRVCRKEYFRLKHVEFSEEGEMKEIWRDEQIIIEDVSLDWREIRGRTSSEVFRKVSTCASGFRHESNDRSPAKGVKRESGVE